MQLKEIHIESCDLKTTTQFYRDVMDLHVLQVSSEQIAVEAGKSLLHFHRTDSGNPIYHLAFDLPENQLLIALSQMEKKVPILRVDQLKIIDFTNWNAKSFYFLDNNGNILEYICRFDNHYLAEQPSISHISEIGLVVSRVSRFVQKLIHQYPVDIYIKQPPSNKFAVIGSEDGLFIVVEEMRPWYPTTKKSQKFKIKIVFSVHGKKFILELPQDEV